MSHALAIAGVTAVLKYIIHNRFATPGLALGITQPTVSALPLDRVEATINNNTDQLNWFLYRVTPNLGWTPEGYPSHDSAGGRIDTPPLAIDLHYLLSAYGAGDMHAEIMLGYAMQLLHENPVIKRDEIVAALSNAVGADGAILTVLNQTNVADRLRLIRIAPHYLDNEEASRIWSSVQAHYRPSMAYHVSVVLIESELPIIPGLPVRQYNIYGIPFDYPRIESIQSVNGANAPIVFGEALQIRGDQLSGDATRVQIGEEEVLSANFSQFENNLIELTTNGLNSLKAGVTGIQVMHDLMIGTPAAAHRGFESNVEAFILCPAVGAITENTNINNNIVSGQITVPVTPAIHRDQRVTLFLNEFNPPANQTARAYSFNAPIRTNANPVNSITFAIDNVEPAVYLARIQVDGARSQLGVDGNGLFNSPQIDLT